MSSTGKSKRRRTDYSLPSLDSVFQASTTNRDTLLQNVSEMSKLDFRGPLCDLSSVPENVKVCWLISRFSLETVMKISQCHRDLPTGLTVKQHKSFVAERTDASVEDADFIEDFISNHCPSLIKFSSLKYQRILSPPTSICLECGRDLVQYHQCSIKCYSMSGLEAATKITLRCIKCSLLYNYSQFGNKRELGFRFYPEPREYIEATDAILIHRQLLELQCSLACVIHLTFHVTLITNFRTTEHK